MISLPLSSTSASVVTTCCFVVAGGGGVDDVCACVDFDVVDVVKVACVEELG